MSGNPIARLWKDYFNSLDHHAVAKVDCRPFNLLVACGTMSAILVLGKYLPITAKFFQFHSIAVPVTLILLATAFSFATWLAYPNRDAVSLFQLIDVPLYGAYVISLVILSNGPASYLFAAVFVVAALFWGMEVPFSHLRFLAIAAGPVATALILDADILVYTTIIIGLIPSLVFSTNVLERRRLIAQRDRSEDVLKHIDRLFAVNVLGISHRDQIPIRSLLHDLKNELAFASWNLKLVDNNALSGEDKSSFKDALAGVDHAFTAAQNYFDAEKNGSSSLEVFYLYDLPSILSEIPSIQAKQHKTQIDLALDTPIRGSAEMAVAALRNLIENALEAGAERVAVSARPTDGGTSVRIEISDNGPGLPKSVEDKLFTPFNTQGKTMGVGLGIYLSGRIVAALGGKLEFVTTGAGGTTFSLTLPVADVYK